MELDEVVRQLAPRLLRYGYSIVGDWDLAEESAQEGLAALVDRWRRWGPPRCPEAFAFAVARRRVIRMARGRRRAVTLEGLPERAAPEAGPEDRALTRSRLEHTLVAIEGLSSREADALRLVVFGELTTEQAAAMLGIGTSAVKMRLSRARARLELALENGHERE